MRCIYTNYFCSSRCEDIAISAHRKRDFGGQPGKPWPKETKCPRCGAVAYLIPDPRGPHNELYWEWQSIIHGYHAEYLKKHGLPPGPGHDGPEHHREAPEIQCGSSGFFLLTAGKAMDVTHYFPNDAGGSS